MKNFYIRLLLILCSISGLVGLLSAHYTFQSDRLLLAQVGVHHVGPDYLYPDSKLTPGKADTLSLDDLTKIYNGQTYSQAHRNVSQSEKNQVCKEYVDNCKKPKEIDHFYPLCAGGSNDIQNLWAQPEVNQWNGKDYGFHAKDKLESYVCSQIKKGLLDPKVAYQKITTDWIDFYNSLGLDKTQSSILINE